MCSRWGMGFTWISNLRVRLSGGHPKGREIFLGENSPRPGMWEGLCWPQGVWDMRKCVGIPGVRSTKANGGKQGKEHRERS